MKTKLILGVAALMVSGVALANKGEKHEGACKKDVQKFCKNVPAGEGGILKCLNEHRAELSPECKERHAAVKHRVEKFAEVCKSDLAMYCSNVTRGKGRKLKCLGKNENHLTSACKTEVVAMKAKVAEHKKSKVEKKEEMKEEAPTGTTTETTTETVEEPK